MQNDTGDCCIRTKILEIVAKRVREGRYYEGMPFNEGGDHGAFRKEWVKILSCHLIDGAYS